MLLENAPESKAAVTLVEPLPSLAVTVPPVVPTFALPENAVEGTVGVAVSSGGTLVAVGPGGVVGPGGDVGTVVEVGTGGVVGPGVVVGGGGVVGIGPS